MSCKLLYDTAPWLLVRQRGVVAEVSDLMARALGVDRSQTCIPLYYVYHAFICLIRPAVGAGLMVASGSLVVVIEIEAY